MKLIALMKKEFARFFGDYKLLITMILPGLLIYIIYSVMGSVMFGGEEEAYRLRVYVEGESAIVSTVESAASANGWETEMLSLSEAGIDEETAREQVASGEASALLVFSENFDASLGKGAAAEIVYNADDDGSAAFASLVNAALQSFSFTLTVSDLSGSGGGAQMVMAGILPMLIVIFVFSSCMSVTLESVAGEKERGTLATILVTSVRRSDIALGKVLPLSCVSLIGAASSFLGVVLSLPTLMGVSLDVAAAGVGAAGYVLLFLLILSFVPLIVAAIAAVSALSRSVKEASGYTSVLMILMMVLSLVTAFLPDIGGWVVAVPILNAVAAMQGILTGAPVVWMCLVSVAVNLAYTAVLIAVIARLLSSERVMFGK